ncbi:MAG: type I 3-dehydroquinate dehydratase [Eubacterium sp.]|nr:type I 3-dehydroquinate dehydratase [Eubacterium sp.]
MTANRIKRQSICVPITAKERISIISEVKKIKDSGADMAEWRIDFFEGAEDEVCPLIAELKTILGSLPLISTLRTIYEGGEEDGRRFDYFSLINKIIEQDASDYVDIEIMRTGSASDEPASNNSESLSGKSPEKDEPNDILELIGAAREKKIKLIGSYHDFEKMPDKAFVKDILKRAADMGADVSKIACMALDPSDADVMLEATGEFHEENPDHPVITMAMGEDGAVTRLYGGLYGSCVSFAVIGRSSAPGQRSISEMKALFDKIYSQPEHIILIGFMGTGKSTVAKVLSKKYNIPKVDIDIMIENKCGKKISDIFSQDGEDVFRKIETDIIDDLGNMDRSVVSCGGGTVLKDINVRKLRALGTIVLLSATEQTVFERVKSSDARPLLNGHMEVGYIKKLMDGRLPAYENAADITVTTDDRSVREIAAEIWERV